VAANLFSIVTVNYWIYHARFVFIGRHPDYVAEQPPTISRAISDPLVGEPFAFWITVCAVLLILGVSGLVVVYLRIARDLPRGTARVRRAFRVCAVAVLLGQVSASVGMYMLSNFRFPDHHEMHMQGSYIFFVSEALVILIGTVFCVLLLRNWTDLASLETDGLMRRGTIRFRRFFGFAVVGMGVLYLVLFKVKNIDLHSANTLIYATYVTVEPMLISAFLFFLALFQTDIVKFARRVRNGETG